MRLTKKRLESLNVAISVDEILAEKFWREHEKLKKEQIAVQRGKEVIRVINVSNPEICIEMQIVRRHWTPNGQIVEVR